MRLVLSVFLASCVLSLILTPIVRRVACFFQLVDCPTNRKVHTRPIPRLGGIALYLAFYLPFLAAFLFPPSVRNQIVSNWSTGWILAGSTIVFAMGVVDDMIRLKPGLKLCVQLVAAFSAYMGGLGICRLELPWHSVLTLGWLSMPVTILWFLLVINGINLIDGLDGLASGVTLFASLVLLVLSLMDGKYLVATGLAALAGANLGFLRYNFNPACIFMGDSGSYFLGYMLAALSILGSVKSQATVAILMPILALGVPLLDTVMAPIRRFALGRKPFQPDKSHIHHKLLELGLTHRNAVLLMYGATIFLGVFTLLIVRMQDNRSALLLLLLAPVVFWGLRRLGYLKYLRHERLVAYMSDVADETGLKKHRRAFLDKQIAIDESRNADEMWNKVSDALQMLNVDLAEIQFDGVRFRVPEDRRYEWRNENAIEESILDDPDASLDPEAHEHRTFSLELPLTDTHKRYGTLHLKKDIASDPLSYYTLRRIEHLRRSIVRKMRSFEEIEEKLRRRK